MNKKIIIAIIAAVIVPAAVYAGSPLFINKTIDEALPTTSSIPLTEPTTSIVSSGSFVGVGDGVHNAEGTAIVISLDDGSKILRLEDFKSTNGPDLYVYLATDSKATDYVSLGPLKANIGNQNYQIPEGTDLSKYNTALIWCKQFSVLFGHASLT
jgi:hypothetical protein